MKLTIETKDLIATIEFKHSDVTYQDLTEAFLSNAVAVGYSKEGLINFIKTDLQDEK